jgi:hypothetical protein
MTYLGPGPSARAMALVASASLALSTAACGGSPQQESGGESASVHGVADWVPIYPGVRVSGIERRDAGAETWTTFRLDSTSDCQKVVHLGLARAEHAERQVKSLPPCRRSCWRPPGAITVLSLHVHE